MLFYRRQSPRWRDSPQRYLPDPGANGPMSGDNLPCRSHQEHFDQQVHHQCSDQRCDAIASSSGYQHGHSRHHHHNHHHHHHHPYHHSLGLGLCHGLPRAMWTLAGIVLVFLILSSHSPQGHGVMALSCAPCEPELCLGTEDCRGGVVKDICDCCQVCAKLENETCGGDFGFLGKCDQDLECVIQLDSLKDSDKPLTGSESGICKVSDMRCVGADCPVAYRHRKCPPDSSFVFFKTKERVGPRAATFETTGGTTRWDDLQLSGDNQESGCVCNKTTCQMPICAMGSVLYIIRAGTGQPGTCCDEFACKPTEECDPIICPPLEDSPCPADSIPLPNIWTHNGCCEIQECACPAMDLCPPVECPAGSTVQMTASATGQPGSCCDQFRCINQARSTCIFDGQVKKHDQRWKVGRCQTCVCQDGINRCKDETCPEHSGCQYMETPPGQCCSVCRGCVSESGQLYNNSAVWKENECRTCKCVNGHAQCQSEMCSTHCWNPKRVPGQCCPVCPDKEEETALCPSLASCPLSCSQGFEQSPDGCPKCRCRKEKCSLQCPFGYKSDVEGNPRCECRPRDRCPSLAEQGCDKKCDYGYKVSQEDCVKCKCNKCPPIKKCTKRCLDGLMLNDEGCPICKCKDKASPEKPKELEPERTNGRPCLSQSGQRHDNGESWDDRCRVCYCHNGKEMCSLIACPTPQCPNPVFRHGDCCPSCPGVILTSPNGEKQLCQAHDGELHVEGETWKMDSCTLCVCHGGKILCETPSCPPIMCHHPVKHANQCCATCKDNDLGWPAPSSLHHRCRLTTGMIYRHGEIWRSTPCQTCVCQDGQFHCYNQQCPVLSCAKTVLKKNQCCPTCADTSKSQVCTYEGESFKPGETWLAEDKCTECVCSSGEVSCHPPSCPTLDCPIMIRKKGQCCSECYDYSHFQSKKTTASSSEYESKTVNPEKSSSNQGLVISLAIPLVIVIVLLIIVFILLLYLLYRRRQFPFHKRGKSASTEHQGSIPFLQSHTIHTKTVPGDKPYLEKLCPELASDRMKTDRATNNYTEIVFGDPNKETVANGHFVT